ncbi:hypothetical protein DPX39_090039900 [Trypanosoma brucei equiperdum]|uniref:Uncharacterized protein n=1 Tax=Trypanosoma brucei equiperdum TaxID=630700 RepID=A0A3L6L1R8_9TRYP|nr:hypothetical protein DPX39_090039900 [Trypanosoma brucei equiperdum]
MTPYFSFFSFFYFFFPLLFIPLLCARVCVWSTWGPSFNHFRCDFYELFFFRFRSQLPHR